MVQALSMARLAQGQVSPNPAVGAVIVNNGEIVGQGYTRPPGSDHAEIVALKQAGERALGATLYVTLEPCCHVGRTPPCTEAIITAGISEVHYAMADPNPLVCGNGQKRLEQAGIKTVVGEHSAEAAEINEAFIKYITTKVPFVTVKLACSLDGKIATRTGDSKWITGEMARKQVHHMRYLSDAIITGANTIIMDDPSLTVRICERGGTMRRQPLRIIVDGLGRTPPTANIFSEPGKTMIVIGGGVNPEIRQSLAKTGAEILDLPSEFGVIDLRLLLKILGEREITNIMAEAGGTLLGSLFDNGLVDKVIAFIAPVIVGGRDAKQAVAGKGIAKLSDCPKLERVRVERLGEDIMVSGYMVR